MKSLLVIAALTACGLAHAASDLETVTIERSRVVVPFTLNLNQNTVRCLVGDYGSKSLKISVPELQGFTMFRQTTAGETAPCINAGSCIFDTTADGRKLSPELILDASKPTEEVNITIVLNEIVSMNHQAKTCTRYLKETLASDVRGLTFRHADGGSLGETNYEACLKLVSK